MNATNNVVPILLYHSISDDPSPESADYTVRPNDFSKHLDLIVEKGFTCMTVSEYLDSRTNKSLREDEHVVLITFDDGYEDFRENALVELEKRNLSSTLYITTGWMRDSQLKRIGPSDAMLSFSDLEDLEQRKVEIGSHSHSHYEMDTLSSSQSYDELIRSKEMLEDSLGHKIRSFAFPHGYSNSRIRNQARKIGYDSCAAVRNALSPATDNPLRLSRLMLMDNTSVEHVAAWLEGKNAPVARRFDSPKTIGWRTFRRTKAILEGKPGSAYL